ncbi:hypothetical protein HN011_008034 [Eciton burchellii]|nr:hypothetical protein HN011_008034 [Eciton burchellii]
MRNQVKISALSEAGIRMWREPPGGGCKTPTHFIAMLLLAAVLALTTAVSAEDESMGPVFVKEPPNRVDFSNGTGAVVECQARGNPQPDIIWVRADGTAVGDVPGLRQVLPNGNLVFPPFRAEDYRQEVHAQVYSCLARSSSGSVHSRDVNVRAVVTQPYNPEILTEYVIRGNSAILKCSIPSYIAEFVTVEAWIREDGEVYLPEDPAVVQDGKYLVLPSGELHIRDVGPEDGYKTYQCRTKHRLTGETRLSATKGRLVITEPVGSVRPKFPTMDNLNGLSVALEGNMPLLCPAQGFPVPSHRAGRQREAQVPDDRRFQELPHDEGWLDHAAVPRSGVPCPPVQFPSVSNINGLVTYTNGTLPLLCPAQGFPVPSYRYIALMSKPVGSVKPKFPTIDDIRGFRMIKDGSVTLMCPAQGFPVPFHKDLEGWIASGSKTELMRSEFPAHFPRTTRFLHLPKRMRRLEDSEPVGSVRPKFPTMDNSRGFISNEGDALTLLCPAQGFPVPSHRWDKTALYARVLFRFLVEPVASTKPKFPMTENSRTYTVHCDRPLTLMCPAQAFPVPAFRYTRHLRHKKANANAIEREPYPGWCMTAMRNTGENTEGKEVADALHARALFIPFSFLWFDFCEDQYVH